MSLTPNHEPITTLAAASATRSAAVRLSAVAAPHVAALALMLHTETRHAAAGYTSQTARVWDDARRPVAVSHQTTAIFD
ncbi:MAG: hypothetical protein ACK495_21570 [Bradyrhizobium sp.]|uniref:hypothetical protein n=1 Tax=Bradyrhizobium sp. TaxID=376 RepID=UPI00391B08EA